MCNQTGKRFTAICIGIRRDHRSMQAFGCGILRDHRSSQDSSGGIQRDHRSNSVWDLGIQPDHRSVFGINAHVWFLPTYTPCYFQTFKCQVTSIMKWMTLNWISEVFVCIWLSVSHTRCAQPTSLHNHFIWVASFEHFIASTAKTFVLLLLIVDRWWCRWWNTDEILGISVNVMRWSLISRSFKCLNVDRYVRLDSFE